MLDEARWGGIQSEELCYRTGTYTFHIACAQIQVSLAHISTRGSSLHIPPLESLVLDLGRFLMGKRVDILVVDGLDGLEELGVFGVVFCIGGLLGFNGIRSRGDALQVHVDDGPVVGPEKEQELKLVEEMRRDNRKRKEGTEERNHGQKKEKISRALLQWGR